MKATHRNVSRAQLEQVGAVEPAVGLGDAGEGGALITGEVGRVFSNAHRLPLSAAASSGCPPGCPA